MHGHARPVERKIRLWIMQQEHNRHREGPLGQIDARAAPVDPRRPAVDARPREQWQ